MGSLENGVERLIPNGKEEEEEEEPLLKEQNQRFCMFPIRYKQLWEMYKKAEASFWTGTFSLCLHCLVFFYMFSAFSRVLIISSSSVCFGIGVREFFPFFGYLFAMYGHEGVKWWKWYER